MKRRWRPLSLLAWAMALKARGRTRFGITPLYFEPGITINRVALSSFFTDEELPRVTSEEPSCEVDQDAPELPRVWNEFPTGEVVSVEPVLLSRVTKELPSLLVVCCWPPGPRVTKLLPTLVVVQVLPLESRVTVEEPSWVVVNDWPPVRVM